MKNWSGIDWINYGSSLTEKDPWLAQRLMSRGIIKDSDKAGSYFNLGIALHMQNRPEAAIRSYKTCLNMSNEFSKVARNNLAHDLLLIGHYKEGWEQYEGRIRIDEYNFYKINLALLGKE